MSPGREEQIIDAFSDLVDTLTADYDVIEFLHRLLHHSLGLLAAEAGGVMIHHDGELRVAAASSEDMETLELFELQKQEGPCFDAYQSGEPVLAPRLDALRDRWPSFVPEAGGLGWVSGHAVPLRLHDQRIGAVNLFSRSERTLDVLDTKLAQGLADVATVGILQARTIADRETTVRQLHAALDSRVVIEQAKGRLSESTGLDMQQSFELLRHHARSRNLQLHQVAKAVIEGDLAADDLR